MLRFQAEGLGMHEAVGCATPSCTCVQTGLTFYDCRVHIVLTVSAYTECLRFRIRGSGFWGSRMRVTVASRVRVLGLGFRVQVLGFRVQGSGFRVWGLRFGLWALGIGF